MTLGVDRDSYTDQIFAQNEIQLKYRVRNRVVKLQPIHFSSRKIYEPARFGQFRADKKGELLLVSMYDKNLNELKP